MTAARKWTKEEIQFIKDNVHMRDKEMAEVIGISRSALNAFRNKIGYACPKANKLIFSEEDVRHIVKLHDEGYTHTEISKICSERHGRVVTCSRISKVLLNNGCRTRRRFGRKEEMLIDKLEELTRFNKRIFVIKAIINPGDCFKTRDKKQDDKTIKGIRLKVKNIYPNFVLTTCGRCVGYDEIEGIIKSKR